MADGGRKGIGRMVWPRYLLKVKDHLDHLLHLLLLCSSLAYHSPLYHYRCILPQRYAVLREHQMDHTLGMGHWNGAGYILGKEKCLYAALIWLVNLKDLLQVLINAKKPLSQRLFR